MYPFEYSPPNNMSNKVRDPKFGPWGNGKDEEREEGRMWDFIGFTRQQRKKHNDSRIVNRD